MPKASPSALQEEVSGYQADLKRLQGRINRDLKEASKLTKLLAETPLALLENSHLLQVSDKIAALAGKHDAGMAKRYASDACC